MKRLFIQIGLINRGTRSLMFWAHLGLGCGMALLFCLMILGRTGAGFLQSQLFGNLPQQELQVGLQKQDVSLFRMSAPGSATVIGKQDLDAMAALKGVTATFPIRYATQAAEVAVSFFGFGFDSEIVIQGIQPEWVALDMPATSLAWQEGETVPIVVSSQLLAIYNNAYAKSRGLPEISPQALSTPEMKITYGRPARQPGDPQPLVFRGKVVGISPRVALGLALPNTVLETLHQRLNLPPPPITETVLRLSAETDSKRIAEQVEALGFAPIPPPPAAQALVHLKRVGRIAIYLLAGCICLFGFAYLNQTVKMIFLLKQGDYAICRAMGMSAVRLRCLLLSETLLLTLFDLVAGLGLGLGAALVVLKQWLAPFLAQLAGQQPELMIPWSQIAVTGTLVPLCCGLFLLPRILLGTSLPNDFRQPI